MKTSRTIRLGFADRGGGRSGLLRLGPLLRAGSRLRQGSQCAKVGAPRSRVSTAPVQKSDFPVYLTGLGTVQGFNTVLVRTRVDGQIDKVAFKEGQTVNQGDLLVEIDPRPYQATLDQAKAKKAQDEANIANANVDLQRYTKLGEFATKQQTDTQRTTVQMLTAQIAADDAAISMRRPSSITRRSNRRSPASPACARSISATSSMPRPRPASSPSPRSSRSP